MFNKRVRQIMFNQYVTYRAQVLVALLCGFLGACASKPTYMFDHDEYTDFSPFKTYRWYDDTHPSREAEYRHYNASDKRVRTYVDAELKRKGYREATQGPADLWINYNISKQQQMRMDSFNNYPAGMYGGMGVGSYGSGVTLGYSSGPSVRTWEEGTVVLDILNASTGKVIWRGIAEGRLQESLTQKEKNHIAAELSRELLSKFPPDATGAN